MIQIRLTRLEVQNMAQEVRSREVSEWLFGYLGSHDNAEFDLELWEPGERIG